MNSWMKVNDELLVSENVNKLPARYGPSKVITIYMTQQQYLHTSCCVLKKVSTICDALIQERQTADILLISAEFQDVRV